VTASSLENPNPDCFVCRHATIPLTLNVEEWTLERLLKTIVKGKLGFEAPTVLIDGDIVWEEGDGADSDDYLINLPKRLTDLPCGGIQQGSVFELDDTTQNLSIEVSVTHKADWPQDDETDEFPFIVGTAPPKSNPVAPSSSSSSTTPPEDSKLPASSKTSVDDDDDDVVLVMSDVEEDDDAKKTSKKKRRTEEDDDLPASKKAKASEEEDDDDDVILID